MIRLLLALYPREWRRVYGDEFAALLEDTRLTPVVLLDVVAQAMKLRATAPRRYPLVAVALLVSVGVELVAKSTGLTANVFWPPTTVARAVALVVLVSPWAALATRARRRRTPHRPPVRT